MLFMANLIPFLRLEHELHLSFQNSELLVLSVGEEQAACPIEIALRFHHHHMKWDHRAWLFNIHSHLTKYILKTYI